MNSSHPIRDGSSKKRNILAPTRKHTVVLASMAICETGSQRRWTVETEAGEWRLAKG